MLIWFSLWITLGVEDYPFGLLTMIVSLEAIFLSTFVMISQNRADEKRQVIADEAWRTVQAEGAPERKTAPPVQRDPRPHQADPCRKGLGQPQAVVERATHDPSTASGTAPRDV